MIVGAWTQSGWPASFMAGKDRRRDERVPTASIPVQLSDVNGELIDLSLVDPDNRRPVDFEARHRLLAELGKGARQPAALLADLADGRAKLHVIRQGLAVRKAHAALFHGGEYRALYADGGYEEQLIAFSLAAGGASVVALAPRLFARRLGDAAAPVGAYWGEARLALPEGEYQDAITGRAQRGGARRLSDLLSDFPVGLLVHAAKNRPP